MGLAIGALILAFAGAAWLLVRLAQNKGAPETGGNRLVFIGKLIVWFGLVAVLLAAKLFPLALMTLLAAGSVLLIEVWKDKAVERDEASQNPTSQTGTDDGQEKMTEIEAAAILGVGPDANVDEITAAYKKLISQMHPDVGGTDYLAAKINEARAVLTQKLIAKDDSASEN